MDEVFWAADDACYEAFEDYTGQVFEESPYAYGMYAPDQRAWAEGDRDVSCAVIPYVLGSLQGSVRDS